MVVLKEWRENKKGISKNNNNKNNLLKEKEDK